MVNGRFLSRVAVCAGLLAPGLAAAGGGVVLKDGTVLECEKFEQRGALYILTTKEGKLVSVRGDRVDTDATATYVPTSEVAPAPAEPRADPAPRPVSRPASATPPKEPAAVMTEADLERYRSIPLGDESTVRGSDGVESGSAAVLSPSRDGLKGDDAKREAAERNELASLASRYQALAKQKEQLERELDDARELADRTTVSAGKINDGPQKGRAGVVEPKVIDPRGQARALASRLASIEREMNALEKQARDMGFGTGALTH